MADIPNDTGYPWRLNKFVEYQHYVPPVHPITNCAFIANNNYGHNYAVLLAWYESLTYCEITAKFMLMNHRQITKNPEAFWTVHKDNLIFGSARKYAKNMDWFVPLMEQFKNKRGGRTPMEWIEALAGSGRATEKFKRIEHELMSWKFMGRFSVDLFMEALVAFHADGLFPIRLVGSGYDWKKTANLTSGLLNITYRDKDADLFDKTGKLPQGMDEHLDQALNKVYAAVKETYPGQETNLLSVVNKICSFRNLFKNARYGGFHHDRQLENLKHYEQVYPEWESLWGEIYGIRNQVFAHRLLGEVGGWDGIRKERKKIWTTKGLTGVETSG